MKLTRIVSIVLILCIVGLIGIYETYKTRPIQDTVNYKIYIYPDGSATINIDNIGYVRQLQSDTPFDRYYYLRAGTLIIPSDGTEIKYEYSQRETIKGKYE